MNDEQLKQVCKEIASHTDNIEDFNKELKNRNINKTASVCWSEPNAIGDRIMGMIFGEKGNIIHF